MTTMIPTEHEKSEWSRLAQDAYRHDLNGIGHRFSIYASMKRGEQMPIGLFDVMQSEYRQWLNGGFETLLSR